MLALFLWLLLLWSLAPLAFPLARRVWTLGTSINASADSDASLDRPVPWPDGGWAAGRMLALVLWTLGAFWAGHAGLPVRQGWVLLGPALVISGVAWARHWKPLREELRQRARAIAIVDGAFLLVFATFLLLRCLWPDLDTGERPMDIALASACARADSLPPPNPYLAGTRLGGYYYLGHLQTALLTTTVGTELRWSYNFACATIPALCASLALPLAAFLCASWKRGAWASLILLGAGTLEPLRQWAEANETGFRAWPLSAWNERSLDYFSTSRVIPNPINVDGGISYTINEYPFFSATYGDLHAHFFAQPMALLLMSLGVALFFNRRPARSGSPFFGRALLAGAVLAALTVTNTWDVPAYWLLVALCFFAPCRSLARLARSRPQVLARELSKSARRRQRRALLEGERSSAQVLAEAPESQLESPEPVAGDCVSARVLSGLLIAATVVMIGLAVPYVRNVHTNATPPTPLDLPATPPISWLLMWGPFAAAWSLALWRAWRQDERFFFRPAWLLAPVVLWLALKLAPSGSFSFPWLRPEYPGSATPYVATYSWGANTSGADYFSLIALGTLLVLSLRGAMVASEARFALLCRLAVCGLVPLIWSELTWAGFLDRAAQGVTYHRQDTVFKFGLQGWFLFGLAAIASALGPWSRAGEDREQSPNEKPLRARERTRGVWRSWAWPLRASFGIALSVMFVSSISCVWGRGLIKSSEAMRHQSEEAIARGQIESRPFLARFASTFRAPDAWSHLAPPEQEAAEWMARRARDGDSLLEAEKAEGGDYSNYTRYGHATGIPTIIGPKSHTFQWGSGKLEAGEVWALVDKRKAQVRGAFLSNGAALRDLGWRQAWKSELGLRFIVLGQLEREEYGAPAIDAMIASAPTTRVFGQSDDPHRVVIVDLG